MIFASRLKSLTSGAAALLGSALLASAVAASSASAAAPSSCKAAPTWAQLKDALAKARGAANGGLNLDMWGAVVSRDGVVCAIAFTGKDRGDQWPGSRSIAAQKAYTANAFSLPKLSLATANLYSAVQPGGSLYGLQHSNPVDGKAVYAGDATRFGTAADPLVGLRSGGVNVFGGGLALYDAKGVLVGAIGVSGDTSCADHNIAWRARQALGLDHVPGGVGPKGDDGIGYLAAGEAPNGFKHPLCGGKESEVELPTIAK
jgi:uncharacterized protein GlcG (DUF336 family)